eukprot:1678853-Pyramimonas_sp.AAC.1
MPPSSFYLFPSASSSPPNLSRLIPVSPPWLAWCLIAEDGQDDPVGAAAATGRARGSVRD